MPDDSSSTPLLADNDHSDNYDETESYIIKTLPANAYFKLPIQILTILISFFSISIFGLLIASYVLMNNGPFGYISSSEEGARDLGICVSNSPFCVSTRRALPPYLVSSNVSVACL